MKLRFGWWNTSLSPIKRLRNRASVKEKNAIGALLFELIENYSLDVIGLCEVSAEDIVAIANFFDPTEYTFEHITEAAGRGVFDMCLICRSGIANVQDSQPILSIFDNHTTRVAQHLMLNVDGVPEPMHVFLSHWSSRGTLQQYHPDRQTLGKTLRDVVQELLALSEDTPIILLGDYNDEPFDIALTDGLKATRDRDLAKTRPRLLYNPFWRHLSHFDHDVGGLNLHQRGTYYERNGSFNRWRTFDQMIFSSSFVRGTPWLLNESHTLIVNTEAFLKLLKSESRIDHLPIISEIERQNP